MNQPTKPYYLSFTTVKSTFLRVVFLYWQNCWET